MKKNSFVLVLSASLLAGNAYAGTMGPITQQPDWRWVGTLSAGPVWQNGGTTQTFYLTPTIQKTYSPSNTTSALFNGEVFAGAQKRLGNKLQGQLGLAVAATSDTSLSGEIWDDADAEFNNLAYHYNLQHTHVAIKGKLLAELGYWLTPWVSGSVGVGFNRAYSYTNTPILYEAIPNANFAPHTQTALSYTLGAGVQKSVSLHWQVGVGYEFSDWGKSGLGRAEGQTQNSGLSLNHLYTNGLMFNLTYLA